MVAVTGQGGGPHRISCRCCHVGGALFLAFLAPGNVSRDFSGAPFCTENFAQLSFLCFEVFGFSTATSLGALLL